jgi:cyclophilin family peptidyl-prolyl cis-trans isomerase
VSSWRVLSSVLILTACFACRGAGTLVQFRTIFGDVELELYDQDKPLTVQNFVKYAQSGAYLNGFSHRLVPGFVVQGGGFYLTNRGTASPLVVPVSTFAPVPNEFDAGRRFSNTNGTIAMAKLGGDTNSATSQWFINLANNSFLDAPDTNNLFVVFGHVIKGTNVLTTLNSFQIYNQTQRSNLVADVSSSLGSAFTQCPLLYPALVETNLLFIDISFLQVGVRKVAPTAREVSWNSATGLTNIIEFTTNLPPIWNTLISTNGNGSRFTFTDSNATNSFRFYRVRVAY